MLFRPARASDMDEICALLATAKQGPEYFHALFRADSGFDPWLIRVAWTGGRIVACAKIYPRALRIGTTVVPAGGIAHLRTDPRMWGQGLATSLLNECLCAMYLDGMLLAPLFARRQTLFARRGWHPIPEVQVEIATEALALAAAPENAPATQVLPFDARDLDGLMALYESANAARTGSAVRGRDDWLSRLTTLDLQGAVLLVARRKRQVVGYVAARPHGESVDALELLLAPWAEDTWLPLLQAAARGAGSPTVLRAILPADYRRLVVGALAPHAATAAYDDLMLRMVDPPRLLHALAPRLSARLRDGEAVPALEVRIGRLRGGAVLRIDGHDVMVDHPHRDDACTLPEATFLELLLGTEGAHAQLEALAYPAAIRDTLRRLFPPQDWVFWRSDAF